MSRTGQGKVGLRKGGSVGRGRAGQGQLSATLTTQTEYDDNDLSLDSLFLFFSLASFLDLSGARQPVQVLLDYSGDSHTEAKYEKNLDFLLFFQHPRVEPCPRFESTAPRVAPPPACPCRLLLLLKLFWPIASHLLAP